MSIEALENPTRGDGRSGVGREPAEPETQLFSDSDDVDAVEHGHFADANPAMRDIGQAHRLVRDIQAGAIRVHTIDQGDTKHPFGGYRQTGDKRIHSLLLHSRARSAGIRRG